ncbi:hypothetical protein K438DRAFT_2023638 [Mycena galopus ATCC 62051]|nr:hypothetical protein K438DRAFT_2023638 [Mycena galopus ATCC 62051]
MAPDSESPNDPKPGAPTSIPPSHTPSCQHQHPPSESPALAVTPSPGWRPPARRAAGVNRAVSPHSVASNPAAIARAWQATPWPGNKALTRAIYSPSPMLPSPPPPATVVAIPARILLVPWRVLTYCSYLTLPYLPYLHEWTIRTAPRPEPERFFIMPYACLTPPALAFLPCLARPPNLLSPRSSQPYLTTTNKPRSRVPRSDDPLARTFRVLPPFPTYHVSLQAPGSSCQALSGKKLKFDLKKLIF